MPRAFVGTGEIFAEFPQRRVCVGLTSLPKNDRNSIRRPPLIQVRSCLSRWILGSVETLNAEAEPSPFRTADTLPAIIRMSIEEKIREIMLSEELPESENLDRLHALIPADVLKIDNLNKATPAQLRRLKEAMAVSEALQEIRRRTTQQKNRAEPDRSG